MACLLRDFSSRRFAPNPIQSFRPTDSTPPIRSLEKMRLFFFDTILASRWEPHLSVSGSLRCATSST